MEIYLSAIVVGLVTIALFLNLIIDQLKSIRNVLEDIRDQNNQDPEE